MAKRRELVARKQAPRKLSLEEAVALLQQRYGGKLAPPLEGMAYRFTIWFPVLAKGKPVFSDHHRHLLHDLFAKCFGGFTQSNLQGFPPRAGSWLPPHADEPIVDLHIHFVVYALQDTDSVDCMRQLKWALQQEQIAAQQVVLIEQVPVQFVEAAELS
jgi:hypothetical protein